RKRPTSLEAYDLCVRARGVSFQTGLGAREARTLLEKAIGLDPDYAEAHSLLALNLWLGWLFWNEPRETNQPRALAEAQRAVALDPNDAGNRWLLGIILSHERRFP
ncbi:adenylate/guanylate cyclase domain-containing protein, partial [Mesorhizobium sp. M2D.F.Ca.ET.178.01.1.1]